MAAAIGYAINRSAPALTPSRAPLRPLLVMEPLTGATG